MESCLLFVMSGYIHVPSSRLSLHMDICFDLRLALKGTQGTRRTVEKKQTKQTNTKTPCKRSSWFISGV